MDTGNEKTCSTCKVEKTLADFYRKNHSQCKKCHYEDTHARRLVKHHERKDYFLKLLGVCCAHCKGVFPKECYDFHHVDPTKKEFHFNTMYSHSMDKLEKEVSKCVLLCSNCHRIEHARIRKES